METFAGALEYSIKKIQERYPSIKIVVQTPTPRITVSESGEIIGNSNTELNQYGKTLVDFVEVEKDICMEYDIPVIDAYNDLAFLMNSHSVYYNSESDGVHLSLEGRKALADEISEFLMREIQ